MEQLYSLQCCCVSSTSKVSRFLLIRLQQQSSPYAINKRTPTLYQAIRPFSEQKSGTNQITWQIFNIKKTQSIVFKGRSNKACLRSKKRAIHNLSPHTKSCTSVRTFGQTITSRRYVTSRYTVRRLQYIYKPLCFTYNYLACFVVIQFINLLTKQFSFCQSISFMSLIKFLNS